MPRPKKYTAPGKGAHTPARKNLLTPAGFLHYRRHAMSMLIIFISIVVIIAYLMVHNLNSSPSIDDRAERIDAYFKKYNMPLEGYGASFVSVADGCGLDWRLLPAIAIRESSGGKRMQFNNPFGWGGARIPFEDIDHAISEVGRNLCGDNPKTARYYSTPSIQKKLYYYNGTVIPSYPKEVMWIMRQF